METILNDLDKLSVQKFEIHILYADMQTLSQEEVITQYQSRFGEKKWELKVFGTAKNQLLIIKNSK